MRSERRAAEVVARALASGPFEEPALVERTMALTGKGRRWAAARVRRLLAAWDGATRPAPQWIASRLLADPGFVAFCQTHHVARLAKIAPVMAPAPGRAESWNIPELTTPAALAAWFDTSIDELQARADLWGREAKTPEGPMRNYRYTWRGKRSGSARLIESPKPRLKRLQQKALQGILNCIPPHEAAHGFRRGASVASFTAPHTGKYVVLRMDLEEFFATIRSAQVYAIFYGAGYPGPVARLLAALCWNAAPNDVWLDYPGTIPCDLGRFAAARRYRDRHLPQGAPTSPALANLCAFAMDCRLAGLARASGAVYTRYADDLLFSGDADFARGVRSFADQVAAIVCEEGFAVHPRKTRLMRRGVRQFAAGVVLNERLNAPRREYELLKAVLHRAGRDGASPPAGMDPESYRAHLRGKIAWMASLNPARARRLEAMYQRIEWRQAD
jgi:hypothetical protein